MSLVTLGAPLSVLLVVIAIGLHIVVVVRGHLLERLLRVLCRRWRLLTCVVDSIVVCLLECMGLA